jgi:hypothetical protein
MSKVNIAPAPAPQAQAPMPRDQQPTYPHGPLNPPITPGAPQQG